MGFRVFAVLGVCLLMGWAIMCDPVRAQDRAAPYWASLRYEQVNMRVGPSREYPIEWVYKRKGLPVKVLRLREGWRLVQDSEGSKGWVAASQLTPDRGALVIGTGTVHLRAAPDAGAAVRWRAQSGVVARLLRCRERWCEIDVAGKSGWALAERLWGVEELAGSN